MAEPTRGRGAARPSAPTRPFASLTLDDLARLLVDQDFRCQACERPILQATVRDNALHAWCEVCGWQREQITSQAELDARRLQPKRGRPRRRQLLDPGVELISGPARAQGEPGSALTIQRIGGREVITAGIKDVESFGDLRRELELRVAGQRALKQGEQSRKGGRERGAAISEEARALRDQIIALRRQGVRQPEAIAERLNKHPVTIRRHLAAIAREGGKE